MAKFGKVLKFLKKNRTYVIIGVVGALLLGGLIALIVIMTRKKHPPPSGGECSGKGGVCASPYDCCPPYTCIEGVCELPCKGLDAMCDKSSECCSGFVCHQGTCQPHNAHDVIPAFQLQTHDGMCLGIGQTTPEFILLHCNWEKFFWSWSKDNLTYTNYLLDNNGKLKTIDTVCINGDDIHEGNSVKHLTLSDCHKTSGLVILTKIDENTASINTIDGKFCATVDPQHGNTLIWQSCSNVTNPTLSSFKIVRAPDDKCHRPGDACSGPSDCCLPFSMCQNDGRCYPCFGDRSACKDYEYPVCDPLTHQWKCVSKCGDGKECATNEKGECVCTSSDPKDCGPGLHGDYPNWKWECELKCPSSKLVCSSGEQPVCVNEKEVDKSKYGNCGPVKKDDSGEWAYCCPLVCQDLPPPPFDGHCKDSQGKAVDLGKCSLVKTPVGNYYKCPDSASGSVCVAPEWVCLDNQKGEYRCDPICCPDSSISCNQTCDKAGDPCQKPVCDESTGKWKCVKSDDPQFVDYCGFTPASQKPKCSDAICLDISSCEGDAKNDVTDWRWKCASQLNKCEAMKYYDWHTIETDGPEVVVNSGSIPIYPTIDYAHCRGGGGGATDTDKGKDIMDLMNNPAGYLIQGKEKNSFVPLASGDGLKTADGKYLYTTGTGDYPCLAPNPCYPHGSFDTPSYPVPAPRDHGEFGPATSAQLFEKGKCDCEGGYIGMMCEYPPDYCQNGRASYDPNTGKVTCICDKNYFGERCEYHYTDSDCNNHGTPTGVKPDGHVLCHCQPGYTGDTCAIFDCLNPPTNVNVKDIIDNCPTTPFKVLITVKSHPDLKLAIDPSHAGSEFWTIRPGPLSQGKPVYYTIMADPHVATNNVLSYVPKCNLTPWIGGIDMLDSSAINTEDAKWHIDFSADGYILLRNQATNSYFGVNPDTKNLCQNFPLFGEPTLKKYFYTKLDVSPDSDDAKLTMTLYTCKLLKEPCKSSLECCGPFNCRDGHCCTSPGSPCKSSDDCCGKIGCISGHCTNACIKCQNDCWRNHNRGDELDKCLGDCLKNNTNCF